MNIRIVDSVDHIAPSLWVNCFRPPYEGRWWYQSMEQSGLEDQFKFFYAVISKNGQQIGIAPAFMMDVPIELVAPPELMSAIRFIGKFMPSALYQRTVFVGSPCTDEGTIGLLPGVKFSECVDALQDAFEAKAKELNAVMIVWKDFPEEYKSILGAMAKKRELFELISFPGTVVNLDEKSKDKYFANLKGSRRHNLKKKLKKSKQLSDLAVEVRNRPDEHTLDEIFALFWQTYEKGKTKFEKLNRLFFTLIADRDTSHFVILRDKADGKMVAFMLCFDLGDRVINKFIGIDYHRPEEWFLYFRLWEAALDWVLAVTKAREFQSGQTGYRAKIDVGHGLVPLTNYCKHKNPFVHKIYSMATNDVTWSSLDDDLKTYLKAHPDADLLRN